MNEQEKLIQTLSTAVSRANLIAKLGYQYGGDRDIYKALGYKTELTISDYLAQYSRQDIARAVINRPANATWGGGITLLETYDAEVTALEKEWKILSKRLSLSSRFHRSDKLSGIGRYGVLLLGLDDVAKVGDFGNAVNGTNRKLLYTKPLLETSAVIHTWEDDQVSERYGLPLTYNVTLPTPGEGVMTLKTG